MEKEMLALVKRNMGPGYSLEKVPVPVPREGELLVRVEAVGICGTDLSIIAGKREIPLPLVPGHEFAGKVAATGPEVEEFSVGDRVTAGLVIGCGDCPYCLEDLDTLCDNILETGIHVDGAFARYVKVPAKVTHLLPESMSYEDGALLDPVASAYRAVKKAAIKHGETVVVVGPGPIGLLAVQIARAEGAGRIIITGLPEDEPRLSRALLNGADEAVSGSTASVIASLDQITAGRKADVVIEATGRSSALEVCTSVLKKCGRLSIAGIFHENPPVDLGRVVRSELTITGSICYTIQDFKDSLTLVCEGRINPASLITHRLPLEDIGDGLALLERREAIKVILEP